MEHFALASCVTVGLVVFAVCSIFVKFLQKRNLYKLASTFEGPSTLPIIGNAHLFIGDTEDIMKRIKQLGQSYSSPVRIWLGPELMFFISTPGQLKTTCLSSKAVDKSNLYVFVQPWTGTGLLTAPEMEHFALASWVTVGLLVFAVCSLFVKFFQRRNLYKCASAFEGPSTLPIIGNAHLFIGDTEDIMKRMNQLVASYSSPIRVWLGPYLVVTVSTPEHFKTVCLSSKAVDKSDFYNHAQPWVGTGLLTAPAAKWRVHRKLIAPTFHMEILETFVEVFAARAADMAKALEQKLAGPEFEISDYLAQYSLLAIGETTMGINLEMEKKSNRDYVAAVHSVIGSVIRRAFCPWLYPDVIFSHTQDGKELRENIKFLHAFTDDVIKKRKKKLMERTSEPSSTEMKNHEDDPPPRRRVFLDHLMQLSVMDGKSLSDEALREEVDTMMVTGSDTAAAVSYYVMLMLASNPEIQEKAYEELCEIYEDCDIENLNITRESLNRMTYMDRVIRETMRVFPIVPYISRKVDEDLKLGERVLPKGSQVVLAIIGIHRNEEYWPDPLKFDPDRFSPDEVAKRHPYSYVPFSAGPRNCIGSKYGMLSVKTLIATILWNYVLKKDHILPVKDIRLKMEFVLRTVDPIKLRIERRERRNSSN